MTNINPMIADGKEFKIRKKGDSDTQQVVGMLEQWRSEQYFLNKTDIYSLAILYATGSEKNQRADVVTLGDDLIGFIGYHLSPEGCLNMHNGSGYDVVLYKQGVADVVEHGLDGERRTTIEDKVLSHYHETVRREWTGFY